MLKKVELDSGRPTQSTSLAMSSLEYLKDRQGIVKISIFGSTSIPFPLYFAIHFPILFKSSFTQLSITQPSITQPSITLPSITQPSITQPPITQPFYYSAFYYSAFLLFSSITQQHFY